MGVTNKNSSDSSVYYWEDGQQTPLESSAWWYKWVSGKSCHLTLILNLIRSEFFRSKSGSECVLFYLLFILYLKRRFNYYVCGNRVERRNQMNRSLFVFETSGWISDFLWQYVRHWNRITQAQFLLYILGILKHETIINSLHWCSFNKTSNTEISRSPMDKPKSLCRR